MRKVLLFMGMLLAVWAFAQSYVDISIGGKFIMRLRAGQGNMSVEERARIVEARLTELLGTRLTEQQITLKEVRKDQQYEIYVRGQLLITVTTADADAAKMGVKQLAEHWLKQLRQTLPGLSAQPPT
jgi:parvulin-like peptidyl-prolyl isomerase